MDRRGFLKLAGVGALALTIPYRRKKKKMTIAFDNAANSGVVGGSVNTFNWDHSVKTRGRLPGAVVGVSILGVATVTSISCEDATGAIGGGLIKNLTFIRGDTNGLYRSELWCIPDLFEFETDLFTVTFAVNLSGLVVACAGSASYSYFGGAGVHGGATGTGDPASKAITTGQPNSYVFSNLCAQTASGIANAASQNNRWNIPDTTGTGMGSDKFVATPASATLQFNGIGVTDVWAQSSVELLSYQSNPPAIIGL